jgi:molybdate/tungstate transport system substrate-binding protein
MRAWILLPLLALPALAQPPCVPKTDQQLIIYRAGSLTNALKPLEDLFACQTGVQVKVTAMGSVDAGRQITAGGQVSDLYAPADYLDIDLFMKPAGYADFNIVFAKGRMVLGYSISGLAAKKLPPMEEPGSAPFHPPDSIPKAASNWYRILTMTGVTIGSGNAFLDPNAYRTPMIFQLAEHFYKVPNLYNDLLEHLFNPGQGTTVGKQVDFQFTYEHSARALAKTNPDYRYVDVPEEINLSDSGKDAYYRQNAVVVLPGLGTPPSSRSIPVPGAHVAWGITLMKDAPNKETAIRFLQLLLGPEGTKSLTEHGPDPVTPALVSPADLHKLPPTLRSLVKTTAK